MQSEPMWIGNDHGGLELKLQIVDYLRQRGIDVVDVGSSSSEIVRYPYYAAKVAGAVSRGEASRGILICSTGIGMSIVIAMIYWGAIGIFKSLGYANYLNAFLAAWGPNLIFGLAGLYLLFTVRT